MEDDDIAEEFLKEYELATSLENSQGSASENKSRKQVCASHAVTSSLCSREAGILTCGANDNVFCGDEKDQCKRDISLAL